MILRSGESAHFSGAVLVASANSGGEAGSSGSLEFQSGTATSETSGSIVIKSGNATTGTAGAINMSACGETATFIAVAGYAHQSGGAVSLRTVRESAAEGGEFVITGGSSTLQGGDVKCISGDGRSSQTGAASFSSAHTNAQTGALDALTAPTGTGNSGMLRLSSGDAITGDQGGAISLLVGSGGSGIGAAICVAVGTGAGVAAGVSICSGCGGTTSGSARLEAGDISLRSGDASASGNFSLLAGNAQSDGGDICFRVGDTTNPLTESNAALSLQAGKGTPGGAVSILGPGGSLNQSSGSGDYSGNLSLSSGSTQEAVAGTVALVTGSSTAQGTGVIYLNTSCVGSSAGSGSLILASGTTTSNMGGDLAAAAGAITICSGSGSGSCSGTVAIIGSVAPSGVGGQLTAMGGLASNASARVSTGDAASSGLLACATGSTPPTSGDAILSTGASSSASTGTVAVCIGNTTFGACGGNVRFNGGLWNPASATGNAGASEGMALISGACQGEILEEGTSGYIFLATDKGSSTNVAQALNSGTFSLETGNGTCGGNFTLIAGRSQVGQGASICVTAGATHNVTT